MSMPANRKFTDLVPPGSWFTIVFTALVLLMLWASLSLSKAAAWIPQLVLCATLVCLLLQLVNELRVAWTAFPETREPEAYGFQGRTLAAFAWLVLLLLLTWLVGIAPASAFFCLGWLRWHAGENWMVSLVLSAGLGLALWVIFSVLLAVDLYPGVLGS
jgi:hypothetical protein